MKELIWDLTLAEFCAFKRMNFFGFVVVIDLLVVFFCLFSFPTVIFLSKGLLKSFIDSQGVDVMRAGIKEEKVFGVVVHLFYHGFDVGIVRNHVHLP